MNKQKTTLAIIQPVYLPWLGYFEQMAYVDHFVFYDDVQYTKQDWRNRNQIQGANGPIWLTVPVRRTALSTLINQVEINNTRPWASKHLKSIYYNYSKAPYFDGVFAMLEEIVAKDWRLLVDLDLALTQAIAEKLRIAPEMALSSSLPREPEFADQPVRGIADETVARRNMRIIEICRHFGADVFYVGARAADYIDIAHFARFGISVVFQDYTHPVYPQIAPVFHSHMSVIDLMMNTGPGARDVLLSPPPPAFAI